jgi:hypothetical protein
MKKQTVPEPVRYFLRYASYGDFMKKLVFAVPVSQIYKSHHIIDDHDFMYFGSNGLYQEIAKFGKSKMSSAPEDWDFFYDTETKAIFGCSPEHPERKFIHRDYKLYNIHLNKQAGMIIIDEQNLTAHPKVEVAIFYEKALKTWRYFIVGDEAFHFEELSLEEASREEYEICL